MCFVEKKKTICGGVVLFEKRCVDGEVKKRFSLYRLRATVVEEHIAMGVCIYPLMERHVYVAMSQCHIYMNI